MGFAVPTLDEIIGILQQRLKQAHGAKKAFADDPILSEKIALTIGQAPLLANPKPSLDTWERTTIWQQVREHYLSTGNQWAAITDIAKVMGINRAAICQVFYSTHAESVESMPHPTFQRIKLRRLKAPTLPETKNTGESNL